MLLAHPHSIGYESLRGVASPLLPVGVLTLMAAASSVHTADVPKLLLVQ
jgi:hypothetical protein